MGGGGGGEGSYVRACFWGWVKWGGVEMTAS